MKIEKFDINDHKKLISLWEKANLPHKPQGRDSYQNMKKQITSQQNFYLVMKKKGELIASIFVTHNQRKGWINRLAVHPEYRGKNIAKKMIQAAENLLHEAGIEIVAALIEDWNKASMQLFKKMNYFQHKDIIYFTKRKSDKI